SVARPDLDHSKPVRRSVEGIHGALPPAPSAGEISTTTVPPSIWSPERTLIARIRPPREALMTCSIFIASMITSGCPTVTESPTPSAARAPSGSASSPTARAHPPPPNAFPRVLECLGLTARRNTARVPAGAGDEDRGVLLAQHRHGGRNRYDLIRDRGTPPTE